MESLYIQELVLTGRRDSLTKIERARRVALVRLSLLLWLVVGAFGSWQTHAQQLTQSVVRAEISHQADTAHLEFRGLKTWNYELKKDELNPNKVILTIPPIDDASIARLQGFSDALISSIKVSKDGPDNTFVVHFDLAKSDVESFEYLTDDPSSLIVDFYVKPVEATKPQQASEAPATPAPTEKSVRTAKTVKAQPKTDSPTTGANRKPAGGEILSVPQASTPAAADKDIQTKFGVFDGGDDNYDRFRVKGYEVNEDAIISSRQNIYLPFPILKMQVSQLDKLMQEQPEYVIHPRDDRENKEARLLMTLFKRGRYGVFLKTYNYFVNQYPETEYLEILKCIKAGIHLERWKDTGKSTEFDQARALYAQLVQRYPQSPVREHNNLILGFALMERGEALATLQTFAAFIKTYPTSPEIPLVRNAIAEAYIILKKFDEATGEYNNIIQDFPKTPYAQEAVYRLGDVAFAKGEFTQAVRLYETAIKNLPALEKVYPNANFNMAEARFWQKDYQPALDNYIQFLKLFPAHQHGGYALTRIGELMGVLGVDQRRIMGAFLESYFRFPNHAGAKVARIRMLAQQMRGMKSKELKKAVEEINGYAEKLDLPGIIEFTTLMAAEGLSNRGEYKQAIDNLIGYYQKNPPSANIDRFKGRILRNIATELKENFEHGKFMQALEFYSKYSKSWLKHSDRIDVPVFVAGAYERAGALSEAESMYRSALIRRKAIVGTQVEREKKVSEYLPSVASLNLRLASTLAGDRKYIEAYQHLRDIGPEAELSPPEVVERVQLNALIAEQRNDHERARAALTELTQKWEGDPVLVAPVNLQLAETQLKLKDYKKAEAHADRVLAADSTEAPLEAKLVASAMKVKADALLGQNKSLASVEAYQKLLERFEDKLPLGSERYKVGQILFDRGDIKGAQETWQRLAGTKDDLLWKVGKEKIDQSKFQDDYTKYINRIPAMNKESKP